MKIATVGKGGSGKTTIAGTLARLLAAQGARTLAIDGDPNPNLALTLGLAPESAGGPTSIPSSIMTVVEQADGSRKLEMTLSHQQVVERFGVPAPGDITLLVMGKPPDGSAGSGCMCASHRAVRGLISEMSGYGEHTVVDMEAGLEHLKRGTARNVDVMLIVVEPYYRSMEAAARIFSLANELNVPHLFVVANKINGKADRDAVEQFCAQHNMPIIGIVPHESQWIAAERGGAAAIDFSPHCPGTEAVGAILGKLLALMPEAASVPQPPKPQPAV